MKRQDIQKPVALITGGSMGIGAACVRRFLAEGWNVSVLALPGEVEWLQSTGVVVTTGDIVSDHTRESAVHQTLASYGRIDLLINNAGVGFYGPPTATPPEFFARLLQVNSVAPLAMVQLVIPIMARQGFGTIVTINSVASRVALPWAAAYAASKATLQSINESLRLELRGSPVHLLNVYPGIIDTNFRQHVLGGRAPNRVENIRYVVSPDHLAAAIFRSVKKRHKNLYVPAIGRFFCFAKILAPAILDWYLARLWQSPFSATEPRYVDPVSADVVNE